eukprot:1188430-Prorocentrum_minimum.AAC.4
MQCVSTVAVDDDHVNSLRTYLDGCPQSFEKSLLYSSASDSKFVDESLRMSTFRAIKDPALFDLCEPIISSVNQGSRSQYTYKLLLNDITHIKYATGGFFKKHKDYLSTTSNLVEEYTLIVCVTPEDLATQTKGGETVIHHADGATSFAATTTPGQVGGTLSQIMSRGVAL